MQLEPDHGRGKFAAAESGALDAPLEAFHGVPHNASDPHDGPLANAEAVGMVKNGGVKPIPVPGEYVSQSTRSY